MAKIAGALISPELPKFLEQKLGTLPDGSFRCPQCHQPVVPHRGEYPHFEHAQGAGEGCPLGNQAWQRRKATTKAVLAEAKRRGITS